jgi:hypothetical protein
MSPLLGVMRYCKGNVVNGVQAIKTAGKAFNFD